MSIERYYGQPLPISVKFKRNPLIAYNKTYNDVENISMNLKRNLAVDTDNRYLEKKQSDSEVTLNENKHIFTMNIGIDDYTKLDKDTEYYLTLNVKVVDIDDYIELPLEDRTVFITSDTNRE